VITEGKMLVDTFYIGLEKQRIINPEINYSTI
jgi:hypothetical protein